jgi:hypothetical protein
MYIGILSKENGTHKVRDGGGTSPKHGKGGAGRRREVVKKSTRFDSTCQTVITCDNSLKDTFLFFFHPPDLLVWLQLA